MSQNFRTDIGGTPATHQPVPAKSAKQTREDATPPQQPPNGSAKQARADMAERLTNPTKEQ